MFGEQGDDRLSGNGADDQMFGGPGKDICQGGSGADSALACETLHSASEPQ
jgi:Ca2+-binding RTX toxin-like protein